VATTLVTFSPQITDYLLEKTGLQCFKKTKINQGISLTLSSFVFVTLGATGLYDLAFYSTIGSCLTAICTAVDKNTDGRLQLMLTIWSAMD